MKILVENGTIYLHFTEDTFIHTEFDWWQMIGHWRWVNFRFIEISCELDEMAPGWETQIVLMGVGLRFRHNFDWRGTELDKRIKGLFVDDIVPPAPKTTQKAKVLEKIEIKEDEEKKKKPTKTRKPITGRSRLSPRKKRGGSL